MEHKFSHISVLLYECIDALAIKPDRIYVDCTLGGGGHSLEIVKKLDTGNSPDRNNGPAYGCDPQSAAGGNSAQEGAPGKTDLPGNPH